MKEPEVKILDMDTHLAKVTLRIREIQERDLNQQGTIDLNKLVAHSDQLMLLRTGLENDMPVADMVNGFFAAFEEKNLMTKELDIEDDGSSIAPSPEELAALENNPDIDINNEDESIEESFSNAEKEAMLLASFDEISDSDAVTGSDNELLDLSILEKGA